MPEYLAPGVYMEEFEIGAKPIEGVSTSTVGFLGPTERGPTNPKLITSFEAFQRTYGSYMVDSYLAYGVQGFFMNGGQRCFVGRILNQGAKSAAGTLSGKKDDKSVGVIEATAVGPGIWGNNVAITVEKGSLYDATNPKTKDLFKLTVQYWKNMVEAKDDKPESKVKAQADNPPNALEVYDNLSPDETNSNYYEKVINGVSKLITVKKAADGTPDAAVAILDKGSENLSAIKKSDYTGSTAIGAKTGLAAFEEVDEISILCVPDETNVTGLRQDMVAHCENMKDRFCILQADKNTASVENLRPPVDSKYAAFYYPWIKIIDPVSGVKKTIPPGGHVTGVYARSDTERGVHKAPANEVVRGVQELEFPIPKGIQDVLNPRGVNCIRAFTGRGIRVWGARTTSSDPLWKYLNIRRLFLYLEESIEEGTQWVVFEPNSERLWARVTQTVTQFLTTVWKNGALMGLTPDEAFFVKCDRTTMTQDDIDNGRLIITIGVSPVKPAEFVIFRIAQWTGGAKG